MNIFSKLNKYNNKIALIDQNLKEITFLDLLNSSKNINIFSNKKEIILILSSNTTDFIITYVASIRSNHVVILLDKSFENLKEIIIKFKPKYIFAENEKKKI